MVLILANLFCWIPAVFGYGIILSFPRKRMTTDQNQIEVFVEPLFGLVILSVLVNIINFGVPIDNRVSLLFLIIGWLLCVIRFRILNCNPFTLRAVILLFLWLLFLSFWATQIPHNFDSGLYHMQSIHWFNKNALPFGLANIHGRFGYNSSWFSVASVIQLPIKTQEGLNGLSISALMIFFFGIAAYQAWQKRLRQPHTIYLALSVLIFVGAVLRTNISSPSPDLAVLILCLMSTSLAFKALETRFNLTYCILQTTVLCLFAFTVKLSSLPLILIPIGLMGFTLRHRLPIQWKPLIGYSVSFAGIILTAWMVRGVSVSGCLVFPIPETCFDQALWTVPRAVIEEYWIAGIASARTTYPHLLPLQQWIGPWFWKTSKSIDFLIPVTLMIAALLIRLHKREQSSLPLKWIVLPHLCAIALWFFSAPDIRFAAGYFWSLSLLLFSAVGPKSSTFKQKLVIAGLLALLVWVPLSRLSYFGFPPVLKAARNPQSFLFDLPIPQAKTTPYLTLEGVRIFESDEPTKACWFAELPCAPHFKETLKTIRSSNGDFQMFYYFTPADTP
jgi:hypothetical protein